MPFFMAFFFCGFLCVWIGFALLAFIAFIPFAAIPAGKFCCKL
jgi:hypothetical protein